MSGMMKKKFIYNLFHASGDSLNGHDSSAHNQYCDGDRGSH